MGTYRRRAEWARQKNRQLQDWRNRLEAYERDKARWQSEHPDATPEQYQAAMRELAERWRV